MKKAIVGVVAALALGGAFADEKPLWTANFAEGGNVVLVKHVKGTPSADGTSIRFPGTHNHFEVNAFPAFDGPVRLSFKVRYFSKTDHNPLQFLDLTTTAGVKFGYIMRWNQGISHSVKGRLGGSLSGSYKTYGDSTFYLGPDPQWHTYTFDLGETSFASRKNATVIDAGAVAVGAPASFKFSGGFGCEVKGIPVIGAHWEERTGGIAIEDFMKGAAIASEPVKVA